ncbi:FCD domain-containing protein, partial [Roseisolibacter sp. H3M3-2]|uniref:FCD domain-containing protein n=1 Tax=Roseisolibacter sp. H3M3-2 TaxID=3031323 RepID=UPI0023DAA1EB
NDMPTIRLEVYRAAGALEASAARAVAAVPADPADALDDALLALDDALERTLAEDDPGTADRLSALHHAFHAELAAACAGPVTRALLDALRPRLERYEWFHGPLLQRAGADFGVTHAEHRAIADAVRAGGADAVERAVRANWDNAAERLSAVIAAQVALPRGAPPQGAAATAAVRG